MSAWIYLYFAKKAMSINIRAMSINIRAMSINIGKEVNENVPIKSRFS